jgi:hypothetical protein
VEADLARGVVVPDLQPARMTVRMELPGHIGDESFEHVEHLVEERTLHIRNPGHPRSGTAVRPPTTTMPRDDRSHRTPVDTDEMKKAVAP